LVISTKLFLSFSRRLYLSYFVMQQVPEIGSLYFQKYYFYEKCGS